MNDKKKVKHTAANPKHSAQHAHDAADAEVSVPVATVSTAAIPTPPVSSSVMDSPAMHTVQDTMARAAAVVVGYLDSMPDGTKVTLKDMARLVQEQTNLTGSNILPIISLIVKSYDGISMERGRFGGIYKGSRTKKPVVVRERCVACKQMIRVKSTGPDGLPKPRRSKKKEAAAAALLAASLIPEGAAIPMTGDIVIPDAASAETAA